MALPVAQFQEVPGGFDFLEEMHTRQEKFIDSINIWDFYGDSSTIFMNTAAGKRHLVHAIFQKYLRGTYFEWLPMELVEIIFDCERRLEFSADYVFYTDYYFSEEDSVIETTRHLRPTREQREQIRSSGEVTRLDVIQTPLGDTFGRRILKNNTAALIAHDFSKMVLSFKENWATSIGNMFQLLTKHMLWIIHHSYLHEWESFMRVIYRKQWEFEEHMSFFIREYGEIPQELMTPDNHDQVWENLLKSKYFLEEYVPYALLSQSDSFHAAVNNQMELQGHVDTTLFDIYMITGVHPNTIDLRKAREFEMEIYAPKYYHETYKNYMKLRSGRRLIPKGELPEFYWCAGKYIQRFI